MIILSDIGYNSALSAEPHRLRKILVAESHPLLQELPDRQTSSVIARLIHVARLGATAARRPTALWYRIDLAAFAPRSAAARFSP
jgi:hypothetical protein